MVGGPCGAPLQVSTLEQFTAAVNETRDRGVGEATVAFELDPASAAKARQADKDAAAQASSNGGGKKALFSGGAGGGAATFSAVSQSVKISFLVSAFAAALGTGRSLTKGEQGAWFAVHDADGNGEISLAEFTAAINEAKEQSKRLLAAEEANRAAGGTAPV
jgi:hypothetical protein